MKKRHSFAVLFLVLAVLLSGCGGRVSGVNCTVGESELYSEAEIQSAMRVVMREFRTGFNGCTLTELAYDEEKTLREAERNAEKGGTGDVMVLVSSFTVGEKSDGSLSPNTTYRGWTWELHRSGVGGWKLTNWGYA